MGRRIARGGLMVVVAAAAICCASCGGGGKQFYPVHGKVVANGQPAHGVLVALHLEGDADVKALRPSATTGPDGSFEIKTFIPADMSVKEGAPAGKYIVTCVWWPLDRSPYVSSEIPDKLKHKYSEPRSSPLRAEVLEKPNDLQTIELSY